MKKIKENKERIIYEDKIGEHYIEYTSKFMEDTGKK